MDVRNLQTVLYPTLLRPNFESLQNMSQNINMGLFIQTCIEQSKHIFTKLEIIGDEASSNHHDSANSIVSEDARQSDDTDIISASNEPSLMESVLSEPGMENIVDTPKVEFRLKAHSDSKPNKRKSFETAID